MREKWIDNAKGIAILLVIIGHMNFTCGSFNFQWVHGIHLVMFFLLSGYTLKPKPLTREYINSKFCRLMIPYFYTCAAILVTDIIEMIVLYHDTSLLSATNLISRDLLRSFFASGAYTNFGNIELGTRIGAIWFLPALFFAILILQFMLQFTRDLKKIGIYTGLLAVLGVISAQFIWLPFSIQSSMVASFFLWTGYAVREKETLSKLKTHHYILAWIIYLYGVHNNYSKIYFVSASVGDIAVSTVIGLSGCLIIYLISVSLKHSRLLSYFGRISDKILCVHLYALETMYPVFTKLAITVDSLGWVLLEIAFAIAGAVLIDLIPKFFSYATEHFRTGMSNLLSAPKPKNTAITRNISVDVARGIFICLMLIGHFAIDGKLRTIIYSCHMAAFIFFSGYFYRSALDIKTFISKIVRTLLVPYLLFVLGVILLHYKSWSWTYFTYTINTYCLGMSFSKNILTNAASVGPVYFILLLFTIRILYFTIDKVASKDYIKFILVLFVSLLGMSLGQKGYWLPWSADVACYGLIFYYIGTLFHKYDLLEYIQKTHIFYFALSPIWVYMIYRGGMEIAIRNYGNYGFVVFGAISGILLIYKFSVYIANSLPQTAKILSYMGKSTMIILIVTTLFSGYINQYTAGLFGDQSIYYMVSSMIIQISFALIIKGLSDFVKKYTGSLSAKKISRG